MVVLRGNPLKLWFVDRDLSVILRHFWPIAVVLIFGFSFPSTGTLEARFGQLEAHMQALAASHQAHSAQMLLLLETQRAQQGQLESLLKLLGQPPQPPPPAPPAP